VGVVGLNGEFPDALGESYEQLLMVAEAYSSEELYIEAAHGVKCPRCWNVAEPADAAHAQHAALCPRCFNVVTR